VCAISFKEGRPHRKNLRLAVEDTITTNEKLNEATQDFAT